MRLLFGEREDDEEDQALVKNPVEGANGTKSQLLALLAQRSGVKEVLKGGR